jgi:superfamily II DNA or RNA helicase
MLKPIVLPETYRKKKMLDSERILIVMRNVLSTLTGPINIVQTVSYALRYKVPNADKIREYRIGYYNEQALLAKRNGDENLCEKYLNKALIAQNWDGYQYLITNGVFGTGLIEDLVMILIDLGIPYRIEDKREMQDECIIEPLSLQTLRDDQQEAMTSIEKNDWVGIVHAPTAYGKTVLGSAIINRLQKYTIIVVDRSVLIEQWKDRLVLSFDLTAHPIKGSSGYYLYPNSYTSEFPVITILGSALLRAVNTHKSDKNEKLLRRDRTIEFICSSKIGLVIYDEVHHAASPSGQIALTMIKARYRIGLTATVNIREDGSDPEYLALIGQVIYYMAPGDLIDLGHAKKIEVNLIQPNYHINELTAYFQYGNIQYSEFYESFIVFNETRNMSIVRAVLSQILNNRSVLVIVDRILHAQLLANRLGENVAQSITGNESISDRQEKIKRFNSGMFKCLIGTFGLVGEGFDIPRIESVVLVSGQSEIKIRQSIGRLMRLWNNPIGYLYDIIDQVSPFKDHFENRLDIYLSDSSMFVFDANETKKYPEWIRSRIEETYIDIVNH